MSVYSESVIGIDIGGSHITAAVVDLESKDIKLESYSRDQVNSLGSSKQIIDTWVSAIIKAAEAEKRSNIFIGIAMPGPFDYDRGISYIKENKKYDALYGLNVKKMLSNSLGIDEHKIRMVNDASAFLQGESLAGAGMEYNRSIGLTLGTGLGTCTCMQGSATDSALWNTKFKEGVAEDYLSTRWFVKRYFDLTGINILDVKGLTAIISQSPTAKLVFKEFSSHLSDFIESFILKYDPEVVILGGNITLAAAHFLPDVIRSLVRRKIHVPVKISKLGEKAALLGAAGCWFKDFKRLHELNV